MAYELKAWKQEGCQLQVMANDLTDRQYYSSEINETLGEGGALNANYTVVEAAIMAGNILGIELGMVYGKDFIFKTAHMGEINFDFRDKSLRNKAKKVLPNPV